MLNPSNAQELTQIAKELGALVLRGRLQHPGPETGNWEMGDPVHLHRDERDSHIHRGQSAGCVVVE